jgi:hypothetical protein
MRGIWGISLRRPHDDWYNKWSDISLDSLTEAKVSHLFSYETPQMSDTSGEFYFKPVRPELAFGRPVDDRRFLAPVR